MKILVVDDERIVADSTALVFRKFGHNARPVYGADEAISIIHSFDPELVVADVNLAGISGIDLAIRLCSEVPDCKLLLVSGQADTAELLDEARQRGYEFEVLAKPVAPSELVGKAMEIVGENENVREKFARAASGSAREALAS